MDNLKEKSFVLRHRLISFFRDIDVTGFRRLSVILPKLLLPKADKLGKFILRTPMGIRMIIDPSTDTGVEQSLYETGTYEKGILDFIGKNFRSKGCFIDIGANIGLMSLYVSENFPKATVHAFEAHPENYRALQDNISINGAKNIIGHQIALGDRNGEVEIFDDHDDNRGGASIKLGDQKGKGFKVSQTTLDEMLNDVDVEMIKIDVEGMELEVLHGAKKLIDQYKPVLIVEVSKERDPNKESEEIFRFIQSLNSYRVYKLKGTKERCSDLVPVDNITELPVHDNIICIAT